METCLCNLNAFYWRQIFALDSVVVKGDGNPDDYHVLYERS